MKLKLFRQRQERVGEKKKGTYMGREHGTSRREFGQTCRAKKGD